MFRARRPRPDQIRAFIAAQSALPFSYAEVGATRGAAPPGYTCDHNRIRLGSGRGAFAAAVAALQRWQMFAIPGIELCWPSAPIAVGTTVAILAGVPGVWSLNACRIVSVIDEQGATARTGFAYGTLPAHAVCGEERFVIEWERESDEVYYDLLAISRPRSLLLAAARPLLRRVQRRFARASLAAMRRAVA
jgi:uncharacterized protein (UPF0548 family)